MKRHSRKKKGTQENPVDPIDPIEIPYIEEGLKRRKI